MGAGQVDWLKPVFGDVIAPFDMNMGRLGAFKAIEKEPVSVDPQDSRQAYPPYRSVRILSATTPASIAAFVAASTKAFEPQT